MAFPAVMLATCCRRIALLPAMIGNFQYKLYQMVAGFLKDSTNPWVELSCTYLMAWFILHYPMLMEPPKTADVPFVRCLEEVKWTHDYLFNIRRLLLDRHSSTIFHCLPSIPDAEPGEEYDGISSAENERLTTLYPGLFLWLVPWIYGTSQCPGYMVLFINMVVIIDLYTPSRFARQLSYKQLYIWNPNPGLQWSGSLLDAARAWYFDASGCMGTKFCLHADIEVWLEDVIPGIHWRWLQEEIAFAVCFPHLWHVGMQGYALSEKKSRENPSKSETILCYVPESCGVASSR